MGKTSKRQDAEQAREFRLQREKEEQEKKRQQNKLILQILIGVLVVALIGGCIGLVVSLVKKNSKQGEPVIGSANTNYTVVNEPSEYVKLVVNYTDKDGVYRQGEMIIHLRADQAPITVANFQNLVSEKFYDGLTFHRVYPGFMIQGGDPDGNGRGGSSETIKGEFSANGVKNELSHVRGVISMARSSNSYNSASSQFFIMHADNPGLDGQYAAFGEVVSGMETVDGITGTKLTKTSDGVDPIATSPVYPVTIVSATFVQPIA